MSYPLCIIIYKCFVNEIQLDAESAIRPSSALSVDAAKHLAKSIENKVELKPVDVITGEENESNVFQVLINICLIMKWNENKMNIFVMLLTFEDCIVLIVVLFPLIETFRMEWLIKVEMFRPLCTVDCWFIVDRLPLAEILNLSGWIAFGFWLSSK